MHTLVAVARPIAPTLSFVRSSLLAPTSYVASPGEATSTLDVNKLREARGREDPLNPFACRHGSRRHRPGAASPRQPAQASVALARLQRCSSWRMVTARASAAFPTSFAAASNVVDRTAPRSAPRPRQSSGTVHRSQGRDRECDIPLSFRYCYVSDVSRARYLMRLTGEFALYARVNRTWWLPPLLLVLAIALLLITVGHAAAPYALYPLF
jgi:hypothetical protein